MKNRIAISEFKSHCLEIIKNLENTNSSIVITKRNKPIATVTPFPKNKKSIIGMFEGKIKITGDIVSPIDVEWDAEK